MTTPTTPTNPTSPTASDAPMSAIEFACLVDALGIDRVSYAKVLDVNDRTVRRWIHGSSTVPPTIATITRALAAYTHELTTHLTATPLDNDAGRLGLEEADTHWNAAARHAGIDTWHTAPNRWWPTILGHVLTQRGPGILRQP